MSSLEKRRGKVVSFLYKMGSQQISLADIWCKGQLNSEWIFEVIVSPKMPTKNLLKLKGLKGFMPDPLIKFQGRNP